MPFSSKFIWLDRTKLTREQTNLILRDIPALAVSVPLMFKVLYAEKIIY